MTYDESYTTTDHLFGSQAETVLCTYFRRMDRAKPVLDIGAGQGRNTLFLARAGYTVDAVDPSRVAVETVAAVAAQEALPVRAHPCDFASFVPPADTYSRDWKARGCNSFSDERGSVRTFLEAGELPRLFEGYEVLHSWEGVGPEHRHGNGPPERHGMVEVVLQRVGQGL